MNITNQIEYNQLILDIFNCYDIILLSELMEQLHDKKQNCNNFKERIKLERLILIVNNYINILNVELSKCN